MGAAEVALHEEGDRQEPPRASVPVRPEDRDFDRLYARYHSPVLRYVRRQVADDQVAQDLTQEAFVRAFVAFADLRDPTRFYPWVRTIARRLVIRHYQRCGRVHPVAELDPGVVDGPEERLLHDVEQQDVLGALARVTGRHREILELREREGLSYRQIAERLGTPVTTVPTLLHRARLALRREYLSLTEHERIAGLVPAWYGALDAARRLRDRLAQAASWFPDAHALSGSVTAVAMGLSGVVAIVQPAPPVVPHASVPAELPAAHHAPFALPPAAVAAPHAAGTAAPTPAPDGGPPAPSRDRLPLTHNLPSEDSFDESRREERAEHDRNMPLVFELMFIRIGVDPDRARRIAERSMAGDDGWMWGEW